MKPHVAITLLLFASATHTAHARTLEETLQLATSHPVLESRLHRIDEAAGLLQAAEGARYPTLAGEALGGVQYYDEAGINGTATVAGANLTLNQYLLDGGRRRANISGAESRLTERRHILENQRRVQAFEAARAHVQVWLSQELARTNKANVEALTVIASSTVSRFNQAEATTTEVAEARSRLFGATAAQAQRETQLQTARADYLEVVGEAVPVSDTLADPGPPPAIVGDTGTHPFLEAARQRLAEAQAIAAARDAGYWPTLDINGNVSHNLYEGTRRDDPSTLGRLTLNLRYAFTDGGVVAGESKGAHAAVRAAQADLRTVQLQLEASREAAVARLHESANRLQSSQQALAESTKAVDAMLREVRMGNRTLRELLDARRDELAATNDWLEAYAARTLAGHEVKRWE